MKIMFRRAVHAFAFQCNNNCHVNNLWSVNEQVGTRCMAF